MVWVDTSQCTCGHVGGYAGYIAVLIAWFGCNLVVSSKLHNTTHICIGSRVAIICRHCNNCGNEKPARAWKLIQHTWINTLKCSCGLLCESFPAVTRLTVYRRPQVARRTSFREEYYTGMRRYGSKNLLQRGILYRHEKILLRQGRLQAQTQENNVG